jgi:hypothetical protein
VEADAVSDTAGNNFLIPMKPLASSAGRRLDQPDPGAARAWRAALLEPDLRTNFFAGNSAWSLNVPACPLGRSSGVFHPVRTLDAYVAVPARGASTKQLRLPYGAESNIQESQI